MNEEIKLLLSSKKKSCCFKSMYFMGTGTEAVTEADNEYSGTLISNFSGSEFNLIDNSVDGKTELIATICYLGSFSCLTESPREIQVYILSPYYQYGDLMGNDENLGLSLKDLFKIGENKENKKILKFISKKPIWNEKKQTWGLDFHGRALYSSIKNMILVEDESEQQREVLVIGKTSENAYNIDIMHPLSPRIAMAIASSSFDFKWISQ